MAKSARIKLKKSELELLRSDALAITGVGIVCFTLDGEIVYSNERAHQIMELSPQFKSPEDLLGLNLRDVVQFEEAEGSLRRRVQQHGRIERGEYRFRTKSGRLKWVQHSSVLAQHGTADTEYIQAVFVDITEQKLAEQNLRSSEVRYRELIEHSAVPVAVTQDQKSVFVNPAMCQLLGYTNEELLGQYYLLHIHPEEHALLAQRAEARLAGEPEPQRYEARLLHKDGRTIWVEIAATLCTFDARPAIQTSYLDITQRKLAETELANKAQLQLAVQQQQAILNNIPDIAWLKDRECRFVAVNEAFAAACGVAAQQVAGATDFDLWPAELAAAYHRDDLKVMQRCQRMQLEEPLIGSDGQQRWIETVKTPIVDEQGEVLGITGIARDITERKLFDDAQRAVQEELEQRVNDRTIELLDANGALQEEIRERVAAQDALAQREQQMRILLDSLPGFAFFKDTSGAYVMCNRMLAEALGTSVEEVLGKTDFELFPAAQAEKYRADDAAICASGEPLLGIEEQGQFQDWQRTIATHKVPVKDAQGTVTGLVGLAFDISERVAAEQRLRETELRLASMMASMPDVVLYETGGGREFVTENIVQLTGIPAAEFVSDRSTFPRLMHADDAQPMAWRIREWREAGEPGVLRLEFRCRRPDGRFGWLEDRMVRVGEGDGRPQYAGVLIDITERKHIELSREIMLRISEASAGETELPELLATVHRELGNLLDVSNFYVALYSAADQSYSFPYYVDSQDRDFSVQSLAGSKTDYVRATGRPLLISSLARAMQAGAEQAFEASGPPAASWLGVPLRAASGTLGTVVVQSYDSEQHYTQQDLELLSLVTDFVAAAIERRHSEARVRASRERLQRVADGVPALIAHFDSELRCQFANQQYAGWFNQTVHGIIGKPLSEILPAPALAAASPYFERVARGEAVSYEAPAFGGPGGRYTQISVTPDLDSAGQVSGYHVIVSDITELKRAQEELRLNEVRLEALLELSRMTECTVKEITGYALEKAVELTQSRIGYLAFTNDDETLLEMYSWSAAALEECAVENVTSTYPLENTGLWGEAVRQRRAVITNDYAALGELKKGYPEGHVAITRHMNIPLFEGDHIVLVAGVGNKVSEYQESDVRQLTLLMDGMWKILQRKRAEEATREAMAQLEAANLRLEAEVVQRRLVQEELRRSEDRYRRLVETAQEGIITDDAEGRITFVNPFLAHALGYDPLELLGRTIADLCDSPSARLVEREGEQRRQGFISSYEIRMQHHNGELKDFLLTANPLYDAQGRYEGALGICTDMTERKRAEAALRLSEERYRDLVEQMAEGVGIVDDSERFTFANPALERLFAVQRGALLGRSLLDFTDAEGSARIRQHSTPQSAGATRQYEFSLTRADGGQRQVLVTSRLQWNEHGAYMGASQLLLDITERKHAEDVLRQSEMRLRQIIDLVPHFIFAKDLNGRFVLVNQAVANAYGTSVEQLIGKTDADFSATPAEVEHFISDDREVIVSGQPKEIEAEIITDASGQSRCLQTVKIPFTFSGLEAPAVLGVSVDITERLKAEQALRASEERYRNLVENISDGIGVTDMDERFTFTNPALDRIFGVEPGQLVGRSLSTFVDPEQFLSIREHSARRIQGQSSEYEHMLLRPDGTRRCVNVHGSPLYGSSGKLLGAFAVVRDVTEQREAERLLRVQRDLGIALGAAKDLQEILRTGLQAAIEAAEQDSGGIYLTDADGKYFKLVQYHGISDEFLRRVESIPVEAPHVQMVLQGGSYFGNYMRMEGADPETVFEGLSAIGVVPIRHEGVVIGGLVVSTHGDFDIPPAAVGALEALAGQIGMALARARVAEALAENERFLQAVFDGIQNGISVLDLQQRILRVNRTMEQWYAHAMPLVGRLCYEVYHGRSAPCETCPSIRAIQTCSPQIEEVPKVGPDGIEGHLELHSFPLLDKNGQPAGVIEYVADVTERRQAARALQYERDLLHTLMDSIPDTVYFKNREGQFIRVNQAQARLLGLHAPEDALGLTDGDFCSPSQAAEKIADEQGIMQSGQPLIGKVERVLAADGRLLWMSTTKMPHRDPDNNIVGTFGLSRDINEIIEAREALRESEERYRMLVDTMDEGIVLLDQHGICHYANPAVYSVLQSASGSLIGEDLRQYIHPEQRPLFDQELERRLAGQRGSYELQIVRGDGEYRDIWVTATPRFDPNGQAIGSLSVLQDITERKLLLNQLVQEQKEETILTLAGGIAHDFNNILVGVLGSATLLMESADLSGSEIELCEMIRTSAQRMSDLTSKLLAYARGGRYQPRPLDVNTAVNETLTILRSSIPPRIELVREQADSLWMIEGDAGQIHQVLLNLIINAYEAMPEGGRLLLRTENAARPRGWRCARHGAHPPGDYVQITVADTGHGIDAAAQARIFEPFFSTKLQGRGLGLAAVQGIIRSHSGCIQVDSAPGQGAVFTILLPRTRLHTEISSSTASSGSKTRELLLFVDDEQVVREMAKRALERRGYRVLLAATGQEGLDVYLNYADEIKLVVFDMQMPEMGGAEMYAQLRRLNPQLKAIASSGFNEALALSEITSDGPSGFIQKPYAPRELMDLIQRVLELGD